MIRYIKIDIIIIIIIKQKCVCVLFSAIINGTPFEVDKLEM